MFIVNQPSKSPHVAAKFIIFLLLCSCLIVQTSMASRTKIRTLNHTVEEAYKVLGISSNPDGSLTREIRIPMVNATPNVPKTKPYPKALSRDIRPYPFVNESFVRLFRPIKLPRNTKLPLIIYFHGGDFVLFSATTVVFHNFCNEIASQFPAIVVSVEYRLAPEHRLPAAYDDSLKAILWAKHQALGTYGQNPWMRKYADFSRVFLLGSASGGNIVYHAALRAQNFDLKPLKIQGIIMNQPYFGGVKRTRSERRLVEDAYVPLYVNDVIWSLVLPKGANRDCIYSNPLTMESHFGRVKMLPKCMVKGNSGDPLVDRAKKLVRLLKSNGVKVTSLFVEGGYHGVELSNTTAAQQLYDAIKNFIHSTK